MASACAVGDDLEDDGLVREASAFHALAFLASGVGAARGGLARVQRVRAGAVGRGLQRSSGRRRALAPTIDAGLVGEGVLRRAACGFAQVMTTVFGSGAATSVISVRAAGAEVAVDQQLGVVSLRRSRLSLTSVESSVEPSVKVTPSLSVSVSWVLSGLFVGLRDQAGLRPCRPCR